MHNGKHIKLRESGRLEGAPLLFSLLYVAKIRETASSSFERAATESWTRTMLDTSVSNRDENRDERNFMSVASAWVFSMDTGSHALAIVRLFRSLSLSFTKRYNEITMKNLARECHWARAGTREKSRYVTIDSREKAYGSPRCVKCRFTFRS